MNDEIKNDVFLKNRKGYSQLYSLHCRKCNSLISTYQKDGSGPLLRLYVDRIENSKYVDEFKIDKKIICEKCGEIIGLGYIYEKENRPSYRLFQNAVKQKPLNFFSNIKFIILNFIKG